MAAATRVNLDNERKARAEVGQRQGWQEEAWGYFDAVPEVKHGVWFMGNGLAKLRLFVATMPEEGDEPVPVTADTSGIDPGLAQLAEAELARLTASLGGQAEIIREGSMNLDVAGEFFLVGFGAREPGEDDAGNLLPGTPESWEVRSVSEVATDANGTLVKESPSDRGRKLDPDLDTIIRVWQRHPRWSALADSHMVGVLGECEALVTLHHQLMAESRSRHNAGLLTVPNELTFGGPHPDDDGTDEDGDTDPLTEELHETFSEPVDNSGSPSAVSPTIIRGPAEFLKTEYLRWIDIGRKPTADLEARIAARVERLARGMNMPVETTLGHQQTTFANAEQVDRDLFDDYMEPRAVTLIDGLTIGFLRPNLLDTLSGDDATPTASPAVEQINRIFVWYDASQLVKPPDLSQAADAAYDRGTISAPAYRAAKRFSEDDAPDEGLNVSAAERIAKLAQQLYLAVGTLLTADEARAILEAAGAGLTGPGPQPADNAGDNTSEPADDEPAEDEADTEARARFAAALLASGAPETPGRRLVEIDRELRTRLLVLADVTMARAIERAGNKLRGNNALRAGLRHVPARLAAATAGRALVAAHYTDDELLADAFKPMREQFMSWGATAQAEAMEVVGQVVGGFSVEERAALGLRQASDLEEAWVWLEDTLRSLAAAKLYDPTFGIEDAGEIAAGLDVPPGLIREAMARAGGAAGIETTGTDAWVSIADAGTRPVGGIGFGDLVRDLLRSNGAGIEGYRWVYGPAARRHPFEPHARLSGKTFQNFDDDVLANASSWPPFSHYMPGDHKGCQCDVEPVIIGPDGTVSQDW